MDIRPSLDYSVRQASVLNSSPNQIFYEVRRRYEDRLLSLADDIQHVANELSHDEVLLQMSKDNSSAIHIGDQVKEMIFKALENEKEEQIQQLIHEITAKNMENADLRKEYQRLELSLAEEIRKRKDKEKKILSLKMKLKDVSGKFGESRAIEQQAKRIQEEYEMKIKELNERVQFLEEDISKKNRQIHDLKRATMKEIVLKDQLSKTEKHIQQNDELLMELEKKNKDLLLDNSKLRHAVNLYETDRNELKTMYLTVGEKVETTLKNESNIYTKCQNLFDLFLGNGGIVVQSLIRCEEKGDGQYYLKKQLNDLRERMGEEIQQHRQSVMKQEKRLQELEEEYNKTLKKLDEANESLTKSQNKIEKYKEKCDDLIASKDRMQREYRNKIREFEEMLERERDAMQRMQKNLIRSYEPEDGRFSLLQRELQEKERLIQKIQMQELLESQLRASHLRPEGIEKMLEVYENKLKAYQRDYISKTEHEEIINELQRKFEREKLELQENFEETMKTKLRQYDISKHEEFNITITNAQNSVKYLEEELAKEKRNSNHYKQRLEATTKKLEEEMKSKRVVVSHLEEATKNISKLKTILENEMMRRKENEKYKEEFLNSKKEKDLMDRKINEFVNQLEVLRIESNERKSLLQCISSVIHSLRNLFSKRNKSIIHQHLNVDNANEMMKQLKQVTLEVCDEFERLNMEMDITLNTQRSQTQRSMWYTRQSFQKIQSVIAQFISAFRKEIMQIRSFAQQQLLGIQTYMEKQLHDLNGRCNVYGIQVQKLLEERNSLEERYRVLKEKTKQNISLFESELKNLYTEVEELQKLHKEELEKGIKLKDLNASQIKEMYEKKLNEYKARVQRDFKKILVLNDDRKKLDEEKRKMKIENEKLSQKLEKALSEISLRKSDLKNLSLLNQQQLEKEEAVLRDLRKRLEEKEKQLQAEEREKRKYMERVADLEKSLNEEMLRASKLDEETQKIINKM